MSNALAITRIDGVQNIAPLEQQEVFFPVRAKEGIIQITGSCVVQLHDAAGNPLPGYEVAIDATGWEVGFAKRVQAFHRFDATAFTDNSYLARCKVPVSDERGVASIVWVVIMLLVG